MGLLLNAAVTFARRVGAGAIGGSIVGMLDQRLLILMMIEILYTVQVSFREHVLVPEPFVLVAMIAAVRRILVLTAEFGTPHYTRIDAPATPALKARLAKLSPEAVQASTLAGEPIIATLTRAPGNGAPIGGLKVVAGSGWFAARPSGTENIYKIYAESFKDRRHLDAIVAEARAIVDSVLGPST